MPGSIQVSVLDFKELPSNSNSVKVSLGKIQHEIGENGTFSFPLANLRDNLMIAIMDSEGNQVSHSGVRTISIIEKGIWDDLFPIEGGGIIHMKLEFVLSDEERKRIRLMREYATKKKQDEILNSRLRDAESAKSLASSQSRHEVSDALRITSSQDSQRSGFNGDAAKASFLAPTDDALKKGSESGDGVKEESFQRQSFTNAKDRVEEASFSLVTERMHQKTLLEDAETRASQTDLALKNESRIPKPASNTVEKLDAQNLEPVESTPTPLQETEVDSNKNNETYATKSKPSDNVVEKLEKPNLEKASVKKTSEESKPPHSSRETKVNTIKNNEIQSQQTVAPKRLQDASSPDAGLSSRSSVIAEKIKSFEEPDKRGLPEKTPRNIKKMISVFESSISQDRVFVKPVGTKSYRVGTVRLLKDHAVNASETSSSTRLRNSFSTGDLRKNISSIAMKGGQAGFNENAVESSEMDMQSIGSEGDKLISDNNDEKKVALTEINAKGMQESSEKGVNDEKKAAFRETILKSRQEDATVSGRTQEDDKEGNIKLAETLSNKVKDFTIDGKKSSKDNLEYFYHDGSGPWIFPDEKRHFCMTSQKAHQENTIVSIPESIGQIEVHCGSDAVVKQGEAMGRVSENSSPKSSDEEDSTGSFGQAIKIALVAGFGLLVILLRQREPGKDKKKGNNLAVKNQVFMNKRGSIGERPPKISYLRQS
ncbi:hypothetical protein OSB04_031360 [Centaurea solstitialis]|uniref:Uncharacterized protein n=1 Tax=Centaurea solstitialis TaxID=347529 RepID=A0AA38VU85_9ASTR|nr:hypothetical protein OSB04_031360 [Centaurea solstitialis]